MQNYLLQSFQQFKLWLQQQELVKNLAQNYPALYKWLLARFSISRFTGLPLLLLSGLLLLNILILSELTEDVVESDAIVQLDLKFSNWLYQMRNDQLTLFFYGITQLGTRPAVISLGALLSVWLLSKRLLLPVACFWLSTIGMGLTVIFGKRYIERPRPEEIGYYLETSFSFPSGHATTAALLFGFAAYLIIRYCSGKKPILFLSITAAIFALLIGFSRIYLGVHYLSDVLAGFMVGGSWMIGGIMLLESLSLKLSLHRRKTERSR